MDGSTPKIEQLENGLKYVKLKKIPTYVRPEPPTPPPPPVLTEEERLAKETQAATAMKQQEIARQAEIKKKEKEAEEDRLAETVYDKIPCSSQRVKVDDRVLYNDKLATVTNVLYEITYDDATIDVVKCDGALINVSYAINQNKDKLYTQRNPRVNSSWNDGHGGKRTRKRNKRKSKTR
jgi:hypothetical protein